jgi:protein-tyrosine phosphatase
MKSKKTSYIDIHCHCLHSVDDGPATLSESIALCRALVDDGIASVIATAHQLGRYSNCNEAEQIREQVHALNKNLSGNNISLSVMPGADVRVDERICHLIEDDKILTLADGGKYILLELPHEVLINIEPLLAGLESLGIQAIISHPERHFALAKQPRILREWLDRGAHLQVTSGSLLGMFGNKARIAAWNLLFSGWAWLVATDAHNLAGRRPTMNVASEQISVRLGREFANLVCVENPLRVMEGRDLRKTRFENARKCLNEEVPVNF